VQVLYHLSHIAGPFLFYFSDRVISLCARNTVQASSGKTHLILPEKLSKQKRAWGMAQEVQCLPSKLKHLSSTQKPVPPKNIVIHTYSYMYNTQDANFKDTSQDGN
jgi:hypothetical protein